MKLRSINALHPYVFRALYDWMIDSDVTPHLLVNVHTKGVIVPAQFQSQENLILSISPRAVVNFDIEDKGISFTTRFNGVSEDLFIPYRAMSQLISSEDQIAFPLAPWFVFDNSQDDELDENAFSLEEDDAFSVVDGNDDEAILDSKSDDNKDSDIDYKSLFDNKKDSKDKSKDDCKDDDSMFTLV